MHPTVQQVGPLLGRGLHGLSEPRREDEGGGQTRVRLAGPSDLQREDVVDQAVGGRARTGVGHPVGTSDIHRSDHDLVGHVLGPLGLLPEADVGA